MKKQICITFVLFLLSIQIFAQGLPCSPCQTRIVKPLPRLILKKVPTLSEELSPCYQDSIVINNNISINNINPATNSIAKTAEVIVNESVDKKTLAALNLILIPNMYRTRGTIKIISGLGLQAIAAGLIAYANIDSYHLTTTTTTQLIPYTYPEYKLSITPAVVNTSTKCQPVPAPAPSPTDNTNTSTSTSSSSSTSSSTAIATAPTTINNTTTVSTPVTVNVTLPTINNNINITMPTYTLTSTIKTGTISFTQTHQEIVVHRKNRTGYYIGAGALGIIGGALEVCVIIDFHHANVYISENTIGVAIKF
jgi:hypothetical protein